MSMVESKLLEEVNFFQVQYYSYEAPLHPNVFAPGIFLFIANIW